MDKIRKITKMKLFLPIFSMILVMMINVIYDIATGNAPFSFFSISINNGILYGRLIDVLNRGSEVAILAIGMTLVVSASAGTDISVGSVMSLSGGLCCMLLAGYGVTNVSEYNVPLWVGMLAGGHTDFVVCGQSHRIASLQQQYRLCACTFFPVFRRILRHYSDADPYRCGLCGHRCGSAQNDGPWHLYPERGHQ